MVEVWVKCEGKSYPLINFIFKKQVRGSNLSPDKSTRLGVKVALAP